MTLIWIIYLIVLLMHLLLGLFSFRRYSTQRDKLHSFSIIVVSHNEENMISPLLDSLLAIDYPQNKLEIILVDDYSSDNTWEIINNFASKYQHATSIKSNPTYHDYKGKKAGLQSALDIAQHDIIIYTDSDASVPQNWLKSFNKYFIPQTGLVIGYIRGENISFLKRYKRIISSGIFAAFCGIGYPFSCSGGNLAIRRELLQQINGYTTIKDFPSGDDKQILNLVRNTKYHVAYNSDVKVLERERELTSNQLYNQAIRHYGKFSLSSPIYQLGFLLISCYYLSLPILSYFNPYIFLLFWLSNFSFYSLSCLKHHEILKLEDFFLTVFYPYYMLYFSLIGSFSEVKWKK